MKLGVVSMVPMLVFGLSLTLAEQACAAEDRPESGEISNWAPIFSPIGLSRIQPCSEIPASCNSPRRADRRLLGYDELMFTHFNGRNEPSVIRIYYPTRLGEVIPIDKNGEIVLHFHDDDLDDPSKQEQLQSQGIDVAKLTTFEICHCKE